MEFSNSSQNLILKSLSGEDLRLLEPHLHLTELPLNMNLEPPNTPIESCFFLTDGIASVVANGRNGKTIEVGLIGREGVTGSAAILGSTQSPNGTFMQLPGTGYRIAVSQLKGAMRKSVTLSETLTKFVYSFMIQKSQTALVNGRGTIDERLARWLLMAHDRVPSPTFYITHEFLALMLGVRRPGVTDALNELEGKGLIRSRRNQVSILDRKGLEAAAGWSYGLAEAEYQRVFGIGASTGTSGVSRPLGK